MTCLDLNLWLCAASVVLLITAIFWFFQWCAAKGAYLQLLADMGVDIER